MGVGERTGPDGTAVAKSWPLTQAARDHPDQIAFVDGERSLTYGELERRVGSLGSSLQELRCERGSRVGYLGANSLAHAECFLGVPAFGCVIADLNFRLAEAELAFMVDDCELELLVADGARLEVARALRDRCPSLHKLVLDTGASACPADCIPYERLVEGEPVGPPVVDPRRPAAISYTGGTTGTPKGVVLSHGNLLANARHNLLATGHDTRDRWLHVCPMFHVAGTANVLACTIVGARQVILPRFAASAVIEAIDHHAITHTVLVPTMLAMLLDELERTPSELATLQHVQYAASPISPDLQSRVLDCLSCDVAQFYGMTEAAPTVSHLTPSDHRRGHAGEEPFRTRLASMGAPVPGVEAEIRGPSGERLAPGEIGEIWIRGPNVMLGYWRRPEATAAALADEWYRSGDAAYADPDGYLYMVDRLKDMIITGGENVYSIEVEAALASHPAVLEAAVFGVPDSRWGEAVHGVVALRPGATATSAELIDHCRDQIAGYKVPQDIELSLEPLPKSGAGKLLKNVLRDPHWSGRSRRVN